MTCCITFGLSMKSTQENLSLPDFDVVLVDKNTQESIRLIQLIERHNKGLILYFYPKDNTQGCSIQATDFTALQQDFDHKGYFVVGVSRDGIKSHQNFIEKKSLTIPLISDPNETLCQYFDVIKEKMMYGKTHLGIVRSSFVFDKNGKLLHSYRNIKAKEHAQDLLDTL